VRAFFTISRTVSNPAQTIPVYELWIRDPSTETWEEEFGDSIIKKRGLKYKGGRRIIVCGGVVLEDGANPYVHGEFPFAPVHCYPETGRFYGPSDISLLLNPQVTINRYNQLLYDSTLKAGGAIVLTNHRYGVSPEMITNDPVQVIDCGDVNAALRMERFPAPSRHIMDHQATIKMAAQDVAGLHDISLGRFTPGNKTAGEISALTESDSTRIRLAAKWHTWALTRIGEQWLSNARQYGDFSWIVRVAGDDGEMEPVEFSGKMLKELEFDIAVADFAMLPDSQQERKQLAIQLRTMQVIDDEELLKTLEWPNYKSVMVRVKKANDEAMAAQMAAQAPQGPPGGAPEGAPEAPPEGDIPPEMLMQMLGQDQGQMPPDMGAGQGQTGMMGADMMGPQLPDGMTDQDLLALQDAADQTGFSVGELLAMVMREQQSLGAGVF
jgi:hypothetical protein